MRTLVTSDTPATKAPPPAPPRAPRAPRERARELRFDALTLVSASLGVRGRARTFTASLTLHTLLVAGALLLPLLWDQSLPPVAGDALRAFFVVPIDAPPPPPPPPRVSAQRAVTAPRPLSSEPARFVAPIDVPAELPPEQSDLGIEGGVAGGVEGGVPGGVVGGVVGGLPIAVATPPAAIVRVGGSIKAPKLLHNPGPVYPQLAVLARVSGLVIVEAQVDTRGRVRDVRVLRGHPLLDEAALQAVREWRYQPLLLNGVPNEFLLTVTVQFNLVSGAPAAR